MGRVEKIVVLSVVFAIVVILVVSTQTGGDPAQAGRGGSLAVETRTGDADRVPSELAPASGIDEPGRIVLSDDVAADPLGDPAAGPRSIVGIDGQRPGGRPAASSALLNAELLPTRPVYEVPETIPPDWDLKTLSGLADHLFDPSLKVYTAKSGDDLRSLARRYYGDEAFVPALERNNEGVRTLTNGQQILLPIHARAIVDEPGDLYVVQDGESLWKIAKKVYGQGNLWGEIWDANRDVLPTPDAIQPGLTLRIP